MTILKKTLISILKFACWLFAMLFSYSLVNKWTGFLVKIYTFWISAEFKEKSENMLIYYPMNLIGGKYITLGSNLVIGKRSFLTAWDSYKSENFSPAISIGNDTIIGEDSHITSINNITIGNNVLIGKKVTITDNDHGKTEGSSLDIPPIDRPLYSKGPVIIEDNVWIGDKVTILANVRIGKNAIIGANALVTKDVPKNCVVGGVPAKVIKMLV